MSKLTTTLAAAAVILSLGSASFADDDDLFSKVRAKSVFESGTEKSGKSGSASEAKRITKTEELRDLLKSAGFEAKAASSRAVTTEKQLNPWTFPVLLVISEDETQIGIMLGLSTIKDVTKELPAETLLKMMTASQQNVPMLFSYHAKRERTEVSQVMKNQGLTGLMLRDEINRMAILAKSTSDVWALENAKTSTTQTTQSTTRPTTTTPAPPTTTTTPAPPAPATSLTGKWSAARSATEAFAVELTANGTFNLVYINNGKQTKSSGKFTTKDGSLSLIGSDGSKLEGKLTITSNTEFSFAPSNSKALVFTKAK